jgi:hypothetical protein
MRYLNPALQMNRTESQGKRLLDFIHRPNFLIDEIHDISETGSVSVLR